jgi:formylglycine-generating enzyme required for sulfatase activity
MLEAISQVTEAIIGPPFTWYLVAGGSVFLKDASNYEANQGTAGGRYEVHNFAIAKYPITNAQYQHFIEAPNGQTNPHWWNYSAEASQWWHNRPRAKPTAFAGDNVSRTRTSWFDAMAFCAWLASELASQLGDTAPDIDDVNTWCVCLPMEQEWQRAAVGDTGWRYPWGKELDELKANYGNKNGRPLDVGSFPQGQSPYGVMDMVGNLWELCRTAWGQDNDDVDGYGYRAVRGSAWNVANPEYLQATDRAGFAPRGRLNDAGFRCAYYFAGNNL